LEINEKKKCEAIKRKVNLDVDKILSCIAIIA